jgi:DNA-binding Xre family transcriptional regulator
MATTPGNPTANKTGATRGYVWHLRRVMADHGMFATTELVPLLAQRGVRLSREQVYRLVTGTPERLNLAVLVALCDILGCRAEDLIEPVAAAAARKTKGPGGGTDTPPRPRPRRAQVLPLPPTR